MGQSQNSKGHPYASMNLKYGHPVEFVNAHQQQQQQEPVSTRLLANVLSSKAKRISAGIVLMSFLAILNLGAFFAALRIGLVFYTPESEGPSLAVRGFNHDFDYPVCLLVAIGDDGDKPNEQAVPYSELYRLIDAAIDELRQRPPATKLLLAADYTTVACKMLRDSLELVESLAGVVELSCQTPGQAYKNVVHSGHQKIRCGTTVVGDSARYVPQLTLEWAQLMQWQSLRVVNLDDEDPARAGPGIPRENWRPTVVTAFSTNHFAVGSLLLRSLAKAGKEAADAGLYNVSVIAYQLEEFNSTLQPLLDCVVREMNEEYNVNTELRLFNFSAVPAWMRINESRGYSGTGEYAWKVEIIHSVLVERGFVLWADAGGRFTFHGLIESLNNTLAHGFANKNTVGVLPKWVHSGMLKYFRYNFHHNPPVPNCDGSGIGFTLDKYQSLARPWYDCSITRQCIAPDGSSRANHRQDQSALTILTSLNGDVCQGISSSVKRHMDSHPGDFSGTNPTRCYSDPLQVYDGFS